MRLQKVIGEFLLVVCWEILREIWRGLSWVFADPQNKSGKKKEPKPKLLGPDVLGWGGGFPREGVGAEKFSMSLETRETKLFWRDILGFCRDIPEAPEKFEKKNCVQFSFPNKGQKLGEIFGTLFVRYFVAQNIFCANFFTLQTCHSKSFFCLLEVPCCWVSVCSVLAGKQKHIPNVLFLALLD